MDVDAQTALHLTILGDGPRGGDCVRLHRATTTVGRGPGCDVRLDDPGVSARHAQVVADADGLHVVDLRSTNGTRVNGEPVHGPHPLHPGDVVSFAGVELRVDAPATTSGAAPGTPADVTRAVPPVRQGPGPPPTVSYDVRDQRAGSISNVAGDQTIRYEQYVHTVEARRADFLRDVAATRTRARWLVWTGLLLTVAGSAVFTEFVLGFLAGIWGSVDEDLTGTQMPELQVREIAGVPSFVYGFAVAGVGSVLLVVGVVLHVVATARTRRVDRELPVPPPWHAPPF